MAAKRSETILVVDDDPQVRQLVVAALRRNGFEVLDAECGQKGLAYFLDNGSQIKLILSDVLMPRMSGPEMVQHILRTAPLFGSCL